MKLIYLSNAVIPSKKAHSVHIMKMCRSFVRAGANVNLVSAKREGEYHHSKNPYELYSVRPDFKIYKVQWFSCLPGKYYLYGLMSALKSISLKPDLIYSRYLFGVFFAAIFGNKVVFESHSDEFNRGQIHKWMIRYLCRSTRCKKIVVISNALKKAYLTEFPDLNKKIIVAHDGADRFMPPEVPAENKFTVGYVGSFNRGKGMEILSELIKKCPDTYFKIAGGSDKNLTDWRAVLENYSNVKLLGFIPHGEVHTLLSSVDVLIAPYQKEVYAGEDIVQWMSPLKIFEYMSAQKPIICSNLSVLREILEDGRNALLCDPDNLEEWVEAIQKLKVQPALRKSISLAAFKDFEENYLWDQRAKMILDKVQ